MESTVEQFQAVTLAKADYLDDASDTIEIPIPIDLDRWSQEIEGVSFDDIPSLEIYRKLIIDDVLMRASARAASERMLRIRRLMETWGAIALLCLVFLGASLKFGIPYEPAAAFLASSLGLFSVFAMKFFGIAK